MGEEKEFSKSPGRAWGGRKILIMIQHISIWAFSLTGTLWTRTTRARNSGSVDWPVAFVNLVGKDVDCTTAHTHLLKDQGWKVCGVAHICNLSPERFKSMCATLWNPISKMNKPKPTWKPLRMQKARDRHWVLQTRWKRPQEKDEQLSQSSLATKPRT